MSFDLLVLNALAILNYDNHLFWTDRYKKLSTLCQNKSIVDSNLLDE